MTSDQSRGQAREAEQFRAQREYKCPDCGGRSFRMGIDFKAPRKSDSKAWRRAELVIRSGKTFYRGIRVSS